MTAGSPGRPGGAGEAANEGTAASTAAIRDIWNILGIFLWFYGHNYKNKKVFAKFVSCIASAPEKQEII